MKKLLTIPTFKSIEEEAEFWDTHSSTDYVWEEVENVKFSKKVKSVFKNIILIKLDTNISEAIGKIAKEKGTDISTASNILIRERLAELKFI